MKDSLKKTLRSRMYRRLKTQSAGKRRARSLKLAAKLFSFEPFRKADFIAFYVSLAEEVDTRRLIDRAFRLGKRVAVPKCSLKKRRLEFYEIKSRKELKKGVLGIPEPKADPTRRVRPRQLDCVLVPGVAFDKHQNRLGRGAGFYDRFLKRVPKHTSKVGLGFSFQIVPRIPTETHDVRLDAVITD